MNEQEIIASIPGALEFVQWFGGWPSFHDAEVLGVSLDRTGGTTIRLHTFKMTSEVRADGCYRATKHAVVIFALEQVQGLDLNGFNNQNVISGLEVERVGEGFVLELSPCYGLAGHITAAKISLAWEAGIPDGSIYAGHGE
jgi:hypothetical protein